jgi:hypothetical protein
MSKSDEFCLIAYGEYDNVEEAKNALQTPFIEDFVEEKGKFSFSNFNNIRVAKGISLADLEIAQIDFETFEISCRSSSIVVNRSRIEELAETLRIYDMFDEIEIQTIE